MTAPGALLTCSTTVIDSPASPAPGSGNSGASRAFGQQLRDANQSLNSSADNPVPETTRSERDTGRGHDKKDESDRGATAPVPASLGASPPVPPLMLNFSLLPADDATAPEGTQPEQPQSEPPNATAKPVSGNKAQELAPDPLSAALVARTIAAQSAPPDLSFAVRLNPNDSAAVPQQARAAQPAGPSAAAPDALVSKQPASLEIALPPKFDNAASNGDPTKDDAKPGPSAAAIRPEVSTKAAPAAVTPVKETRHADLTPDAPAAPRTQTFARVDAFQAAPKTVSADSAAPRQETTAAQETAQIQTPLNDQVAKPPAPLKDLSIQVGQTQQDKVELRVVERSGELRVAVRAADPDLSQGLRQGLSDLVNRLEQNGFRAEGWRPGANAANVQAAADTRQKSTQFQNHDGSQSQSGGSQQGRQQNRQNQSYRPAWVQELEGNLGDPSTPSGESYGITR